MPPKTDQPAEPSPEETPARGTLAIAESTASEIRELFGGAKVRLVSSQDPAIPKILKTAVSGLQQVSNVLAIECENGLGVVVSSEPEHLGELLSGYPVLHQSTLTQWQGHYLYWVRRVASAEEKPLVVNEQGVEVGAGAVFIGKGLIPVAINGGRIFVVCRGSLPPLGLTEPVVENNSLGSSGGAIPPEQPHPVAEGTESGTRKPPETLSACGERLQMEILNGTPAVQAIRRRLGPEVPLKVCGAYQKDIAPALRGVAAHAVKDFWGPPPDLIAVDLGQGSGDLAVVGCQSPEDLNWFRQANLHLRSSFVTVWNQWTLLWLRTDARPKNVVIPRTWIWLSKGAVPVSWPGQLQALIHLDGPVSQVCFGTLKWPAALSEAFLFSRLEEKHGSPFRRRRGKTLLRETFWADWLAQISGIAYHPKLREFRLPHNNAPQTLSEALLFGLVRDLLQNAANSMPNRFPIDEIKASRIRQLIRLLKVVARVPQAEPAAVKPYCLARLKLQLGAKLTTEEIWLDYFAECKRQGQSAYTKGQFLLILPAVIGEVFGFTKSGDIRRKRGFRRLAFSSAPPSDKSEQIKPSDANPS